MRWAASRAPVVETTGYNGTKSAFADWRATPARSAQLQQQKPDPRANLRRGEACLALPVSRDSSPDGAILAEQPPSGGFLPLLLRL
jgi:hypothetical protein